MKFKLQAMLALFCSSIMTSASAGFQTHSDYQSAEPYGNAQTTCFRNAIVGGGPSPLSADEEARLVSSLPLKETGHFYGRIGVNNSSVRLSGLKTSINNLSTYQTAALTTTKTRKNKTGLEMALGYFWSKNFRVELEVLFNKTFNYSSIPMFISPGAAIIPPPGNINPIMDVELKNSTLLMDGYYEFMFGGYDRFHPFVVGVVGVSSNRAKTTLTPRSGVATDPSGSRITKKTCLALGGGIGFRFAVFSRVSVYASLRYISLGRTHMQPINNYFIKGNYSTAPFSVGVTYLF